MGRAYRIRQSKKNKTDRSSVFYIPEAALFVLLAALIITMLISERSAEFDIHAAADSIKALMDADALQEENALKIRDRFGLSDTDYADAVYYGPVSNMDVEELLILRLNPDADTAAVQEALQARVDYQKTNFDGYGTDQMELLNHAVILAKGNYAALIISKNAEAAEQEYQKFLKGGA